MNLFQDIPGSESKQIIYGVRHLLRLPEGTSAKAALTEARKYHRKPQGGQKTTWLKMIDNDMRRNNIKLMVDGRPTGDHEVLAQNRHIWRCVVAALCRKTEGR